MNFGRKRRRGYANKSNHQSSQKEYNSQIKCDICNKVIQVKVDSNPQHVWRAHMKSCKGPNASAETGYTNDNNNFTNESTDIDMSQDIEFHSTSEIESSNNDAISSLIPVENNSYLLFQNELVKTYEAKENFKSNKPRNFDTKPKILDTLAIYAYTLKMNYSEAETNDLIGLIHEIHERNDVKIPLPNNFRTMRRQCGNGIISSTHDNNNTSTFDLVAREYRLGVELFPEYQKSIVACSYNIKQILSEYLLNLDPCKFIRNPDVRHVSGDSRNRIYEEFTTGKLFEKLNKYIRKECKADGIALCIGITLDDTQIRSGKRTFTPVYLYVLNVIDDAFKMILLGFAPGDKLPYTDEEIGKVINETYSARGKATIIKEIIKHYKRKFQRDFLYDILEDILKTQDNGVFLRVGNFNNPNGFYINAFIHLCVISGDNLQLDKLAGTHFQAKQRKCRICMSISCHSLNTHEALGVGRDDKEMKKRGQNLEKALMTRCQMLGGKADKTTSTYISEAKEAGINCGDNKLIELFKWQNDRGISSFYKSLAPDYLHTVTKGLTEDSIAWAMCVIDNVSKYEAFKYNLTYLDDRIKNFSVVQSLVVFPNKPIHRFQDGISIMFKSSMHKMGSKTTGFFASGSIEAWKLPQLLLQLIFCINTNIVPFTVGESSKFFKSSERKWNIGRVIVNCLTAVFELHLFCRMKIMTTKSIHKLMKIINNARAQLSLLRMLKNDIMTQTINSKAYGGIKHHLVLHLPEYKKFMGADHRQYDTEMSEKAHTFLKSEYETVNKQYKTVLTDLLFKHRVKQYYVNMNSYKVPIPETTTSSNDSDYKNVKVLTNDRASCILAVQNETIYVKTIMVNSMTYRSKVKLRDTKYCKKSLSINNELITFADFISIAEGCKVDSFQQNWQAFKNHEAECCLVNKLGIQFDKEHKTDNDYFIHCNNCYFLNKKSNDIKKISICDFVEVRYEQSNTSSTEIVTAIARLVGIFSFNKSTSSLSTYMSTTNSSENKSDTIKDKNIYLMICWMESATNESVLPYSSYKYATIDKSRSSPLHFDIVPIHSVHRPAWLVSHASGSTLLWGYSEKTSDLKDLKKEFFYCLTYKLIVRDQCEDFIGFVGDYPDGERPANVSGSTGSNSSSNSSSILNKTDQVCNSLPMMLSVDQIKEVDNVLMSAVWKEDNGKKGKKRKAKDIAHNEENEEDDEENEEDDDENDDEE